MAMIVLLAAPLGDIPIRGRHIMFGISELRAVHQESTINGSTAPISGNATENKRPLARLHSRITDQI